MCVVSMIGDFYRDTWEPQPWFPAPGIPAMPPYRPMEPMRPLQPIQWPLGTPITREEFDELKRQVAEMIELLKRAKKYDEDNGEPDCEIDEKMDLLRKVAAAVGVNLDDVLKRKGA